LIFKVIKTSRENNEVSVEFRHVYPKVKGPNISPTASGMMRFDLTTKALLAAEMSSTFGAQKSESVATIDYDGSVEGFPRLKKRLVTTTNIQPDASTTKSELREEFDLAFDKTVSVEAFTLAAFGLPEPRGIAWPQSSRVWVWWGLAGIVLIVIGCMSRRWWPVAPPSKTA
jgi:hypothetical protein